jgi:hypothetical protein
MLVVHHSFSSTWENDFLDIQLTSGDCKSEVVDLDLGFLSRFLMDLSIMLVV